MMREKVLIQFFCQSKVYGSHGFWKARFSEVTQETIWLRNLPDFGNDHGLAVAILYCKDREPAITWAESHYATYILVSNFAFLALAAQIYLLVAGFRGWFEWPGIGWASLAVVTVLYSTLGLALDRYLYTYQVAMRQATVLLLMDPVAPEGLGPANEGADLGGGSRAPRRRSRK
ncbi:MAG TPA: hypothetical protein DD490_25640 [Acidobacteria bacterium]|nr:hypothetical protein [Acidobacteriota bacterium]